MRRILVALLFLATVSPVWAWNAAGHRLVAIIAWEQMSPPARDFVMAALARHPDYERWRQRARSDEARQIFAEASTWPDDIRNDPRFHDDEELDEPAAGFPDSARHKDWHYVDLDADGGVVSGQLTSQLKRISRLLRCTGPKREISYHLPWLLHLVADIHQPLHVGRHGDEGGNSVEIENPFNGRLPFTNVHTYWDDLPGPPWLRGKRLQAAAEQIIEHHPKPPQRDIDTWASESHALLPDAYPKQMGSLLPTVDEAFDKNARQLAEQRIAAAGYRLGKLLDNAFRGCVSRETQ